MKIISSSGVVEFDNSFSYLRSKKIWYSITIESALQDGINAVSEMESL